MPDNRNSRPDGTSRRPERAVDAPTRRRPRAVPKISSVEPTVSPGDAREACRADVNEFIDEAWERWAREGDEPMRFAPQVHISRKGRRNILRVDPWLE